MWKLQLHDASLVSDDDSCDKNLNSKLISKLIVKSIMLWTVTEQSSVYLIVTALQINVYF